MLSRKTALAIADTYYYRFTSVRSESYGRGYSTQPRRVRRFEPRAAERFFFTHDFSAWFLQRVRAISEFYPLAFHDFLTGLHTGEAFTRTDPATASAERHRRGQEYLHRLAECALVADEGEWKGEYGYERQYADALRKQLELDGYVWRNGKLYYSESDVIDADVERDLLVTLIREAGLAKQDVLTTFLERSETFYSSNDWNESVTNSRNFLESVLREAAARHHAKVKGAPIKETVYSSPNAVRQYLESSGLITEKDKEGLNAVYKLLSEQGVHPYLAQKDQARLMRHQARMCAQFILSKLQAAFTQPVAS